MKTRVDKNETSEIKEKITFVLVAIHHIFERVTLGFGSYLSSSQMSDESFLILTYVVPLIYTLYNKP